MRKDEKKVTTKSFKKLKYEIVKKEKAIYLGTYEGTKFDGTDRLSMAVQPDAVRFIKKAEKRYKDYTIFFEGDRLFNAKFLTLISKYNNAILILSVDEKIKKQRHKSRDDTQSEVFLKGRKTKILNIANLFPFIILVNHNRKDLNKNASFVKKLMKMDEKKFRKLVEGKHERGSRALATKHSFW